MRRIALALALLLLAPLSALTANEGNIWYFGSNAGVDFNSGSPVALLDGAMNTGEGCASISDSSGNLLFYTDGSTIYNRLHAVMPNGTGLFGNSSSTQSAIIVQVIGSTTEYYVFTATHFGGSQGINYSIVDMTLDGGDGDVTTKNQPVIGGVRTEKIAIAKHANGTDLWLLTTTDTPDQYLAFPITAGGVSTTPVVSPIALPRDPRVGYLRVSPDNSKVAATLFFASLVELLDFDDATGTLTLVEQWALPNNPYGLEFSPSSALLYVGTQGVSGLVQYDLSASSVSSSSTQLAPGAFQALALGPDGKIYISVISSSLHVIDQPNVLGTGANYIPNAVSLSGRLSLNGLPTIATFLIAPSQVPATSRPAMLALAILLLGGLTYLSRRLWV